jgi:hypothetical protein
MKEEFIFPEPPKIDGNGAVRIPPSVSFGKNSANRSRGRIEQQAIERNIAVKGKGRKDNKVDSSIEDNVKI